MSGYRVCLLDVLTGVSGYGVQVWSGVSGAVLGGRGRREGGEETTENGDCLLQLWR